MLDKLHDFKDININWFRLEFTDEPNNEIGDLIKLALNNINNVVTGKKSDNNETYIDKLRDGFTRGHYYRGVE